MKYIIFIFIMIMVLLGSCKAPWDKVAPDVLVKVMPASCPHDSKNCVRLSDENPHRVEGISPIALHIESASNDDGIKKSKVWKQIDIWARKNNARILYQEENYRQYKLRTPFFKFPDDVFIQIDEDGGQLIFQSQSRIGKSDLGKNKKRAKKFLSYFNDQ